MKSIFQKIGILASTLLSFLSVSAYDFEVDGIYYNILSLSDLTCEVTYNDNNKRSDRLYFKKGEDSDFISTTFPSYIGNVVIPETVYYKGKMLTVTSVGEYAFLNCKDLISLSLPSTIENISQVLVSSIFKLRAGAFDYCGIQTLTAGNAYILQMFDESYATKNGMRTQDNLKNLFLSNDFNGIITVNYSSYSNLITLKSLLDKAPEFSDGPHFSNEQYINLEIIVPEDALPAYQAANVWKDFWELKTIKFVKSLTLNQTSLSLEPKQEYLLTVTALPEDAYDKSVTWFSSDPSVATVDNNGLVTAITKGNTNIIVSTNDGSGIQTECLVHVDLLVKDIRLSEAEIGLEPGNSKQLTVIISPKDAFVKDVVWSSEDEDIASVDNQGKVTANKLGVTNICVKTTDGSNITATCKVIVAELVKSISVEPNNLTIIEGETAQLSATVSPENATYKECFWTSDDSIIASVDANGVVTAISAGTTRIKATASDGSGVFGQCEITVTAKTIEQNGICYQRNSLTTLRIVPNLDSPYSGDFIVPAEAMFDGSNMPVTEIGEGTFANCDNLTSIVIPNTVSKINNNAFTGCNSLNFVKICDGSLIEVNLDAVFQDSPITILYIGSNHVTYNTDSRLLNTVKSMTLGSNVTVFPPKEAFNTLNSFIVEEGDNPIEEPNDYCTTSMELISQQTIRDPHTYIYYRFFYLVTYTHLSPILNALQNSTLNYLHIGREVQQIEVDTSKTYEKIPTTAGSRYQEFGYMDEINYQYEDIIVISDYNRHPVESIAINEGAVELNIGETIKLSAKCMPIYASFTEVAWSTSDANIAVVDIFGNVTKIGDGEATIIATTTDGSNLSASCKVTNPGAGIEDLVIPSEDGFYLVYNLQGILVHKTKDYEVIKQLPAGIYIVNSIKIVIR